jgi:hypothetical protein
VLRAGTEDAAHRDVGGLEADEVVLADQGAGGDHAVGLAQAHPVDGVAAGQRALANRVACNIAAR